MQKLFWVHTAQLKGRTKLAIFGPRAIFEVLPRAKNLKLTQENTCTHRPIPKYARNTEKPCIKYFRCTQAHLFGVYRLTLSITQNELFLVPGAIFEVLPRAKNWKLCQEKTYTHRPIPKYARNTGKPCKNYFGCTQAHLKCRTKLAIFGPPGLYLRSSPGPKI